MTKDYTISLNRFIALIMIMLCHICQYYGNEMAWWLNCGVQIFLLISGFLYGQRDNVKALHFYKNRLLRILIEYYLYLIIIIPIYIFFAHYSFSTTEIIKLLLGMGVNVNGLGHLWFVSTIIICYLITPYMYSVLRPRIKWLYIVIILATVEVICAVIPGFTGAWINCYIIGLIIGNAHIKLQDKRKCYIHIIMIVLPIMAVLIGAEITYKYIMKMNAESIIGKVANTVFHYGHISLALFLFLGIMIICKNIKNTVARRLLDMTDKYSYDIYIVHLFFILGPCSFFSGQYSIAISLLFLIVCSVLFAVVLKKTSIVIVNYIE